MKKAKATSTTEDIYKAISKLSGEQITAIAARAGSDKRKRHWKTYAKNGSLTNKKAFLNAVKEELAGNIRKIQGAYNAYAKGKLKDLDNSSAIHIPLSVCGIIDLIHENRWTHFVKAMEAHRKKETIPFIPLPNGNEDQMTWWKEKLLYTAIGLGRARYAIALVEDYGADVTHVCEDAYTPFLYAAQNGMISFINLCLRKGTDINQTTPDGITALMLASFGRHATTVKLLLDRGIDATRRNCNGQTALDLARIFNEQSHPKTVKYLEQGLRHDGENHAEN